MNQPCLACVDHIKDLPRKDLGVDVDNDFVIEDGSSDKESFMKEFRSLAKKTSEVVVATDPDRR